MRRVARLWRYGDDKVRQFKATVLQALADKRIGLAQYLLKDGNGVLGHAAI